jgi:outer membrane receptor protein involved in Fe transport
MRNLLVLAALLPLASAAAEPTAANVASDPRAADVVVTATRDRVSASQAPASITRLDGEDFALAGSKHQAELLNQVAGVYIQRGGGAESLTAIRSPVLTGAGACGAFLVAEDSLPIRPVGFCNLNEMFELNYEQAGTLEVLRGPGSAMFGASAVHGVINAITPRAQDLPRVFLGAETGSDSFKRVRFGAAHALAGSSERDIALYGLATRAPGWRDASGVDELKLNLLGDVATMGGKLRVRAAGSVLNQETAGFIQGFDSYRDEALARSNPNPEAFRDASSARLSAHFDREFGMANRLELAGIYRRSRMDFSQHFLIGKPVEHNAQTSYMASGAVFLPRGDLTTRIAFDAESASTELTEFQPGPATDGAPAANAIRPAGFHYDYGVDSSTVGGTLSFDYRLTERLRASAAVRVDTTNYDYDNHMLAGNTDQNGIACGAAGCLYSRPADRSDRFDNVSPRVTLAWVNRSNHVYASASTGYRPPEMTELYRLQRQQIEAELDSEHLESLELGWKWRPGGAVSLDTAVFFMKKTDVILRESNGFNVGNGATRHRGLEYTLVAAPMLGRLDPRLTISGTVARHEYAFSRAIEGGEAIADGNDIDTAPRNVHSVTLSLPFASYKGDRSKGWEASVAWNHVGAYFLDAANTARYPGHDVATMRLRWTGLDRLAVVLSVDNVFDTDFADRADFAFGNFRYFPGRGRAAFLSVDFLEH